MKQQQELWDCQNATGTVTSTRPFDLKLDGLISILNGEAILNVHCYEVDGRLLDSYGVNYYIDLEMMIRTSKEFNFQIAAFHHALEVSFQITLLFMYPVGLENSRYNSREQHHCCHI